MLDVSLFWPILLNHVPAAGPPEDKDCGIERGLPEKRVLDVACLLLCDGMGIAGLGAGDARRNAHPSPVLSGCAD